MNGLIIHLVNWLPAVQRPPDGHQSYLVIAVPTYDQPDESGPAVPEDGVSLTQRSVLETDCVHLQDLIALPGEKRQPGGVDETFWKLSTLTCQSDCGFDGLKKQTKLKGWQFKSHSVSVCRGVLEQGTLPLIVS